MKESTWKECIEESSAISASSDYEKAKALRETAEARIRFLKRKYEKENVSFIFEGYYSSAIEMLHAHVIEQGFKVKNHICLGYYLRDILRREDLYRIFDDCRVKRNLLVYYGRKLHFETATMAIGSLKRLIKDMTKETFIK